MTDPTEVAELEDDLRRRLTDIAATTTVDPDAWGAITRRAAAMPSRRRPTRRQVAAVAAAVALAVGALALSRGSTDHTETVDETTTTTERGTSSTTRPDRASTSLPGGPAGGQPTSPTAPGGTGGVPGAGPGGDATPGVTDPGGAETGTGPSPSPGGIQPPGTTAPPPATPTAPDGRPIAASVPHDGHTYGVTAYQNGGNLYVDLWRDASSYLTMSSWALQPGQNCLAGDTTIYTEGEASLVRWGIVRADAAAVQIVTAGGDRSTAALGSPTTSGVRAWIGVRPAGDVDRYEAYDTGGNILHTATAPGWNAPGPC